MSWITSLKKRRADKKTRRSTSPKSVTARKERREDILEAVLDGVSEVLLLRWFLKD